jgi:hypothetical protein
MAQLGQWPISGTEKKLAGNDALYIDWREPICKKTSIYKHYPRTLTNRLYAPGELLGPTRLAKHAGCMAWKGHDPDKCKTWKKPYQRIVPTTTPRHCLA